MTDHSNCGRGTAESGPEGSDCACRTSVDQDICARAGCGFCRAQRQEDKARTFAPPPGWERRMVDGRFRLVKCAGGCPPVNKLSLGPPVAHNPAFDIGLLRAAYPAIDGYAQFIASESGAEMRIHADVTAALECTDPRVDQGEDEAMIAHGAGPSAPRRRRRSYCKCGRH